VVWRGICLGSGSQFRAGLEDDLVAGEVFELADEVSLSALFADL
jgi:hypothetical protein